MNICAGQKEHVVNAAIEVVLLIRIRLLCSENATVQGCVQIKSFGPDIKFNVKYWFQHFLSI